MYKKVVVPLDGSPLAEVALPYAEEVAGKLGTKMILLTVLQSDDAKEQRDHYQQSTKVMDITRRHIGKYLEQSGKQAIKVDAVTRFGSPAEGILEYVSKGYPSLIVMATHGRSGLGRWAVGSVADKIVRATNMQPLMLIRAKGAHPDIRAKRILKKVLVPLDGSTQSEAVIPYISEIAYNLQMELTLLRVISNNNHTYTDVEAYLQRWCQHLKKEEIPAECEIRSGNAADQIIDLADELASDLVAMSTRGQAAVSLWPLGSVAQKVLLGGNTPLLLVKS